jgi:hypothetical protein
MASGGKKKTTMAKLNRERRLMERRLDKQAKKQARKLSAAHDSVELHDSTPLATDQAPEPTIERVAPDVVIPSPLQLHDSGAAFHG